jgi:hypothetical protein
MRKILSCAALGAALLAPAFAHAASDDSGLHPVVGVFLTGGGSKTVTVQYTNGDDYTMRAGQLFQLYGGVEYRVPDSGVAVQVNVGYHFDSAGGSNGDVRFTRYPVEAIALYQLAPQWRLGVGVRDATSAKLHGSGAANGIDANFNASLGAIVQAEWLPTPRWGVQLRYVHETYKLKDSTEDLRISGNHVGLGTAYYF